MNDHLLENKPVQVNTEPPTELTKELTDVAQFKPTPAMRIWLDTAIQTESDSPTEIAAASQLSRQNWYDWLDMPGFIEWYRGAWEQRLRSVGPKLDAIGLRNAKRDHKFWESMQKRVGNLQSQETMGASFKDGEKEIKIIVTRGS